MNERTESKQGTGGRARVVVIGGGYAGVLAALRIVGQAARRRVPVAVALVNPSPIFVERIRLHELAAGGRPRRIELFRLLGTQVELVIGRVRRIDAAARAVEVELVEGEDTAAERAAVQGGVAAMQDEVAAAQGEVAAAQGGVAKAAAGKVEARRVEAATAGSEVTRRLGYDALVYAPGSAADPEVVPGGREHAFTLADAASSRVLHARLRAAQAGDRVVVVGGGLTAIEAAAEIAEAFPALRVALAARGGIGEGLSASGRGYLGRALGELGVAVRTGVRAVRVDAAGLLVVPAERDGVAAGRQRDGVAAGGQRDGVAAGGQRDGVAVGGQRGGVAAGWGRDGVAAGGQRDGAAAGAAERIAADIVVLAAGFRPAALAASSGLATVAGGRLSVDRWLRAPAHPEIWGVGDAAAALDGEGAPLRMGCATAMPQAAYAADGIVAALAGDPQPPPFTFAFLIQCISLGRRRGLIQRVDPRDRPLERVLTGRLGAWAKEIVCRFTVASLHLERIFSGSYSWPGKEPRRKGAIGAADPRRLPSGAAT